MLKFERNWHYDNICIRLTRSPSNGLHCQIEIHSCFQNYLVTPCILDELPSNHELGKTNPTEKVKRSPTNPLQLCRLTKEYKNAKIGTELHPIIWNKVKLMVLFIGYTRSGHSLVGSLLDAHPNIIISDELRAFDAWERFSRKDKTRDHLFQAMYTNSVQMATMGERALGNCKAKLGGYKYKVPNQWQGRFDKVIQVLLPLSIY